MKNHVETLISRSDYYDLESKINEFCLKRGYNPISISVIWSSGTYVAFVVVEEGENNAQTD